VNAIQRGAFSERKTFVDRILNSYLSIGLIAAVGGSVYFAVQNSRILSSSSDTFALGIALGGLLISSGSLVALRMRRGALFQLALKRIDEGDRSDGVSSFLRVWTEIEVALRNLVASRLGESTAGVSPSRLFTRIEAIDELSEADVSLLHRLLSLRNSIVHGIPGESVRAEARRAIGEAEELLDRLGSITNDGARSGWTFWKE
jgi:hypothetical protein